MRPLRPKLPKSLHDKVREIAKREGVAINQLIATAAAEKTSALLTIDDLAERATRGSRNALEAVLAEVSDREPAEEDRLE